MKSNIKVLSRLKLVAVKPGRAWSGKLKKLDELMAWMYDKDILNKTDKDKKATLFRSYYRWYNDGDFPRTLGPGYSKYMPDSEIEKALEEKLEEFIKQILRKYAGKYSRTDFRYDQFVDQLDNVIRQAEDGPYFSSNSILYWLKEAKGQDEELSKLGKDLEKAREDFYKEFNKFYKSDEYKKAFPEERYGNPEPGRIEAAIMRGLKEAKVKLPKLESLYDKEKDIAKKIADKAKDIKESAKKAKALNVF